MSKMANSTEAVARSITPNLGNSAGIGLPSVSERVAALVCTLTTDVSVPLKDSAVKIGRRCQASLFGLIQSASASSDSKMPTWLHEDEDLEHEDSKDLVAMMKGNQGVDSGGG